MDRLATLEIFVKVVELGSFTDAAQALGISKSHCSKQVRRLEDRLQARLVNRTTRQVSATGEGRAFYERCVRLMEELEEAERAVGQMRDRPTGTLRVSLPLSFGVRYIGPAMTRFMRRYPELGVEMHLNDRKVDIIEEGFDMAIRVGTLADSSMIARKLAVVRNVLCAAPGYLAEHGTPTVPGDLREHSCLMYHLLSTGSTWHFRDASGDEEMIRVEGRLRSDNGDTLVQAALAGLGVLYTPDFFLAEHIRQGRLVPLLPEWSFSHMAAWALYPHTRHLSARVRLFIDHLVDEFSPHPPWECLEPLDPEEE